MKDAFGINKKVEFLENIMEQDEEIKEEKDMEKGKKKKSNKADISLSSDEEDNRDPKKLAHSQKDQKSEAPEKEG